MSKRSINQKLISYRTLIVNSRNPEIAPLLANYGIDAAYLDKGDAIIADTMRLMDLQNRNIRKKGLHSTCTTPKKTRWKECLKQPANW